MSKPNRSRRNFLKLPLAAAVSASPLLSLMMSPRNALAASTEGYKALVCVFLQGGNDSFNMVVPRSSVAHASYAAARQGLAVAQNQILPITPASYSDGADYGFHPSMPEVQQLFSQNRIAIMANTGTLARPITKAEYEAGNAQVPDQLFSHNSQQDLWMSADATSSRSIGWGGGAIDRIYPDATQAPLPSPNITVAGSNLWQVGVQNSQYDIPAWGVEPIWFPWHDGPIRMEHAYPSIYAAGVRNRNKLVAQYATIQQRATDYTQTISSALENAPKFDTAFPGKLGNLDRQLRQVAKLIAIREQLGAGTGRQMFYVSLGGWDTHDDQVQDHAAKLQELSRALSGFDAALNELGLANQVTTFTASEFGRSLTPNNNGTDHGWGGHSLVMGAAVNGGNIYGTMPEISLDSPDAVEEGRVIPTTSVEQYSATLARWFGLSDSEIAAVFPNLANFSQQDMGFMLG